MTTEPNTIVERRRRGEAPQAQGKGETVAGATGKGEIVAGATGKGERGNSC